MGCLGLPHRSFHLFLYFCCLILFKILLNFSVLCKSSNSMRYIYKKLIFFFIIFNQSQIYLYFLFVKNSFCSKIESLLEINTMVHPQRIWPRQMTLVVGRGQFTLHINEAKGS